MDGIDWPMVENITVVSFTALVFFFILIIKSYFLGTAKIVYDYVTVRACINDVRKIKIGKSKIKNKCLIS